MGEFIAELRAAWTIADWYLLFLMVLFFNIKGGKSG